MDHVDRNLANALRETADRLTDGARYEWGHMGRCNCGHLVQTLTDMTDIEIAQSVDYQLDEWSEHAKDYCEGTSSRVEDLFETLKSFGLSSDDMRHLEHLSDRRVLSRIDGRPTLRKNDIQDVSVYMHTMADLLEQP
tara:strand:- start:1629 stop:2039 length:411 start_codon:yes stop_codon:yes gene_type:complete